MAAHRPFPPSPRRRDLARRAGLHAASPMLVGAGAASALLVAATATQGVLGQRLGAAIAAACRGHAALALAALPRTVIGAALPMLGAAASAAVTAHLVQTRGVWLPRRHIAGAPAHDAGAAPRTGRAAGALAGAAAIGGTALAWLWLGAPRLAALPAIAPIGAASPAPLAVAAGALVVHLAATLAVAWIAIAVVDAVVRHAALAAALAMTPADKREDDRLAGADPRWRARRAALAQAPGPLAELAGASMLLVGDGVAVAVAWHPAHQPVPVRIAAGRGIHATQLLGLARRHQVPIRSDPALAAALAGGRADGRAGAPAPVPRRHWPRLAQWIAATRSRDRKSL